MDYVEKYLDAFYAADEDRSIYQEFIKLVFKEIAFRMEYTTNIEDIEEAFHKIGLNNDINELLNIIINYAILEKIPKTINENLNHEPLLLIYEDYAQRFCDKINFPRKEIIYPELNNITR